MLAKLFVVLLSYLLLVFLAARIFEISSTWLKAGCLASQLLSPFTLSVRKLKAILEERGVSYTGLVEKKELAELVEACGTLTGAESCSISAESSGDNKEESNELQFTGASHFFEEVEDTKAGTWLVDVIPEGHSSLLRRKQWLALRRKIVRFGIRIGTFNCGNDPRLCIKYGWKEPSLAISMPQGNQPKGNVILKTYDSRPSVELVFRWISKELSLKIETFDRVEEFSETFKAKIEENPVYVLLFTTLPEPPLYLASLSVQFTGRVRFGHVRAFDWTREKHILKNYSIDKFPSLMIFTPEGNLTYGHRKGEWVRYHNLELFLKTLHPDVNDVFVTVFLMMNMSCFMALFIINGGILKRFIHFVWLLIFYNTSLIILCLPVLAMLQLPCLTPLLDFALKYSRYAMTSDAAAIMRNYLFFALQHKWFLYGGYLFYGMLIWWVQRRIRWYSGYENEHDSATSITEWLTQDLHSLTNVVQTFPYLGHSRIDYSLLGLEDGFEPLMRRLAVPELWLHPIIPTEYLNSLPVWKFRHSQVNHCCDDKQENCTSKCNSCCKESVKPPGMLVAQDCSICLEDFNSGCMLLGLPCGHCYHQKCIEEWLCGGNSSCRYCCPVCRWPAFKQKPLALRENLTRNQAQETNV
ncbi:E3 ubiquitin-protein ligase RNF103-like [Stylophora pistillata]|uniref:E3 ubiquitin-protein ligase RNF103 n=1 Tax=Stylophora pistillata TaxID=50429 RepID=A0A2B4SR22_STYPI|nr:E3 ubiquitin-protein ligase RNF103-like [Stylophora pistillata]PFX31048.1 E3 ubiquitin-protein ligase RNF103 [Stylophora pistillata]